MLALIIVAREGLERLNQWWTLRARWSVRHFLDGLKFWTITAIIIAAILWTIIAAVWKTIELIV